MPDRCMYGGYANPATKKYTRGRCRILKYSGIWGEYAMATVIDIKDFECSESALMDIAGFVGPFIDNGGVRIRIKIQKLDEDRQWKKTAQDILRQLLDEGRTNYREYGYNFDFYLNKYYWDEKPVHITQSEALFLYRWLILNQRDHTQMYFIYNIRKRYGKEFLQEVSYV
jgi:hypothetical protein